MSVSSLEKQRKNKEQQRENSRMWASSHREQTRENNRKNCRRLVSKGNTLCRVLETHHEELKADPERLTTEFMLKLIRKGEKVAPSQHCLRCGYEFYPRSEQLPQTCPNPKCRSPYWNKPRKVK